MEEPGIIVKNVLCFLLLSLSVMRNDKAEDEWEEVDRSIRSLRLSHFVLAMALLCDSLALLAIHYIAFASPHARHDPLHQSPPTIDDHARKFAAPQDIKDQEHLKSHLADEINVEEEFSEAKLKFFYFKMFDMSNDGRIDGLEIYHALLHDQEEHDNATTPPNPDPPPLLSEAELEAETDRILYEADRNWDGFIAWPEFVDYVDKQLATHP